MLRSIYKFFDKETGYKVGGRRREQWWWKTAALKQLRDKLEVMLLEARARQQESGKCDEG